MRSKEYIALAEKYEVRPLKDDPILFCYMFDNKKDIEIAGVISTWLSYGDADKSMSKILYLISDIMDKKPYDYIMSGIWCRYKDDYSCLYRLTSWHNFAMLCDKLRVAYLNNKDLEEAVYRSYANNRHKHKYYFQALCDVLSGETMIPTSNSLSANNRINLLLRWFVRKDSKMDIGIWNLNPAKLVVPCDTQSLMVAKSLGMITKVEETQRVVFRVTDYSSRIFPDDPARMSFVLYGLSKK